MRGTVIGGVLVVPFGALFFTADAAFAELGSSVPVPSATSLTVRLLLFGLVLVAGLALALARGRGVPALPWPVPARRLSLPEWAIPLALLDALFLVFVTVQLTVLFGGHDHVLETAGLTYAEYAREGFWQLLLAASLTLVVLAAAGRLAAVETRRSRVLKLALTGLLCVLTLVVLAAALHRLRLYEDAFGLTRLRITAEAFGLWLAGVFALLVVAGLVRRARASLPWLLVAGTGSALLAFSLSNPDARIAEANVERWRSAGSIDVAYLASLSADAVPALRTLPAVHREAALDPIAARLGEGDGIGSANLARHRARRLVADPHR